MPDTAKDGTNRGGARPGAGRKKKSLDENITEGKTPKVIKLPAPAKIKGVDVPPPGEYLAAKQKDGSSLEAADVYTRIWEWVISCGCEKLVDPQLVEEYAMSFSRWKQCQQAISDFGFLAKHPTTGAAIASPYVSMARDFEKQASAARYQIYQIIKEDCSTDYAGPSLDPMEQLLNSRRN